MNRTAAAIRRLITRNGAVVLEERNGAKHLHLQVKTALGAVFWLTIERGTANDPRKHIAWTKQAMRRADARK